MTRKGERQGRPYRTSAPFAIAERSSTRLMRAGLIVLRNAGGIARVLRLLSGVNAPRRPAGVERRTGGSRSIAWSVGRRSATACLVWLPRCRRATRHGLSSVLHYWRRSHPCAGRNRMPHCRERRHRTEKGEADGGATVTPSHLLKWRTNPSRSPHAGWLRLAIVAAVPRESLEEARNFVAMDRTDGRTRRRHPRSRQPPHEYGQQNFLTAAMGAEVPRRQVHRPRIGHMSTCAPYSVLRQMQSKRWHVVLYLIRRPVEWIVQWAASAKRRRFQVSPIADVQ